MAPEMLQAQMPAVQQKCCRARPNQTMRGNRKARSHIGAVCMPLSSIDTVPCSESLTAEGEVGTSRGGERVLCLVGSFSSLRAFKLQPCSSSLRHKLRI